MNILAAQINPVIGDLAGNYAKVKEIILKNLGRDLIVFPELTLIGYPPNDLLLRKGFVEDQLSYIDDIKRLTRDQTVTVIIGAVTRNNGTGKLFRNAALVLQDGAIIHEYHKQLLPTYNVFDENRYFEAGSKSQVNVFNLKDYLVAILICEDCWNDEAVTESPLYPTNPVAQTVNLIKTAGKKIIVTINASPSHVGKNVERYRMYETLSRRYGVEFLYVNQVGGQDDLIFDGFSFYINSNKSVYGEGYKEQLIAIDTDSPVTVLDVPSNDYYHNMMEHLKLGLKDYCAKTGFETVVVGSSGGIDSALVLTIAKEALGNSKVYAITMPSKFSSEGSVSDSEKLCKNLGIRLYTRPIMEDVDLTIRLFKDTFHVLMGEMKKLTIENLQARTRGRILMEFSNNYNALLLSTGNKSETSVGYCTLYGDTNGGLALIADLYKTEVYGLAKWYNEQKGEDIIPKNIIDKAPSAELWEGQKDTDSLPPYDILDALLKLYLENEFLSRKEKEECHRKILPLRLGEIEKYISMVDRAEFKRKQCPPTIRVHNRAWGFGRNLPIAKRVQPSIKNLL